MTMTEGRPNAAANATWWSSFALFVREFLMPINVLIGMGLAVHAAIDYAMGPGQHSQYT